MGSSIKMAACTALQAALQAALPGVTVTVPQAAFNKDVVYPSIAIVPGQFNYDSNFQEHEQDTTVTGQLLVSVGDFEGTVELRLAAQNQFQRQELEEQVLQVFLATEGAPGMLITQTPAVKVGGVQYLYQAIAAFEWDQRAWREEMVFNDERYSYLTLNAAFPALASRQAYTIETLVLAIGHDLEDETVDYEVQINSDGSMTPYPGTD